MSSEETQNSNGSDELAGSELEERRRRQEAAAMKLEISLLKEEVKALQNEIFRLRNSSVFRLREKILPTDSYVQRLFLSLRSGAGFGNVGSSRVKYLNWTKKWDTLSEADRQAIRADLEKSGSTPLISLVMPVYNPPADFLTKAIQSVTRQLYPNWELCIVDDASTQPHVKPILERFSKSDSRIKVHFRGENGHISVSSNDALDMAKGSYIGFVDHDDLLREHALYTVFKYLQKFPEAKFLYSDEDKVTDSGERFGPTFKPDWDPIFYLACNYTSHFSMYEAEIAKRVRLRPGYEGAQDWDFALRFQEEIEESQLVHIPHILYHWRSHSESTAKETAVKPYVAAAQMKSVESALARRGEDAFVVRLPYWEGLKVSYQVPIPEPRVSVIIPTRDKISLLSKCLTTLFELTNYPNYEIVVMDNGSEEPESLQYLEKLVAEGKAKVIRVDEPFNYSALNNRGVRESTGEVVALLNNDIEIVEGDWMNRLTAHALRNEIGAVGPRLLYPDGRVQHGGVLVGFQRAAGHNHRLIGSRDPGYLGRAIADQQISAVTGACLFVTRENYDRVGGLDEELAVAFNDVDFCLKLVAANLRNVYAGSVTCIHHESVSRGLDDDTQKMARSTGEAIRLRARWQGRIAYDPAYNPNLSLESETFALAETPRVDYPWRVSALS